MDLRLRAANARAGLGRGSQSRDRVSLGRGAHRAFERARNQLVRLKVDVIVTHNTLGPLAAKQATSTIPIVFATAGDLVGTGIVESLARPGGNVTGLSSQTPDVAGKRLELLREIIPDLRRLAILSNIGNPIGVLEMGCDTTIG
jgi:putative tryptophan/tyrosine transport system substrate-binding protein